MRAVSSRARAAASGIASSAPNKDFVLVPVEARSDITMTELAEVLEGPGASRGIVRAFRSSSLLAVNFKITLRASEQDSL